MLLIAESDIGIRVGAELTIDMCWEKSRNCLMSSASMKKSNHRRELLW